MIKFNDNNIYVGYIKELLHTFNLPQCKIHNEDNNYYVGEYFINKELGEVHKVTEVTDNFKLKESQKVCNYKFGNKVLNITKNLEIRNNYYDTYTHEYLGEYLRFIKAYKNIDLMSMYNCFSNNSFMSASGDDKSYVTYMIPVKPNTKYTIALKYVSSLTLYCGFYGYNRQFDILSNTNEKVFNATSFNEPIVYETSSITESEECLKKEKYFKLFIKLPVNYIDNIVVLEGDYIKSTKLVLDEYEQKVQEKLIYIPTRYDEEKDVEVNVFKNCPVVAGYDDYTTKNQLLALPTSTKYLLADRLIEYLSQNVITPDDEIIDNIKRLQVVLASNDLNESDDLKGFTFSFDKYGVWSDDIRRWLNAYLEIIGESDNYTDMLSYVDKDVEKLLRRLHIRDEYKDVVNDILGGFDYGK